MKYILAALAFIFITLLPLIGLKLLLFAIPDFQADTPGYAVFQFTCLIIGVFVAIFILSEYKEDKP